MARKRPWLHYLVSILGIGIGFLGVSRLTLLPAFPRDFPLNHLRYPATIDQVRVDSAAQLRFRLAAYPAGSTVTISSPEGSRSVTLTRARARGQVMITLVTGLIFFLVNILVFCPHIDRGYVRDFYWATLLYGLAIHINGLYVPMGEVWPTAGLSVIWILTQAALPVIFVHVTLIFPRRRAFLDRHRRFIPALVLATALLIAWQSFTAIRYFHDPRPETWVALRLPEFLARLSMVILVAAGFTLLFQSSRRVELDREREQMKWLLWGFSIGVAPYVFFRVLPKIFGFESHLGREIDHLLELTIPIAFTLTVVRYRFLDIDIIIRRSLIYTALAGFLVALYLFLALLVGRKLSLLLPGASRVIDILSVAVPMALFAPTRRILGRLVDRTLFRIRTGYAEALRSLRSAISGASSQQQLALMVRAALEEHLQPKRIGLVLQVEGGVWISSGLEEVPVALPPRFPGGEPRGSLAVVNSTSRPEMEQEDFPTELRSAGVQVATPLVVEGRPAGWILLGEKQSERRYVEEDLELLEGIATEAATALERIRLVQMVAEEAMEHKRLDEIDRLKNDFLSRVSHDLRTPLTSISWSVQNLLDGVVGPVDEAQREYLSAIQTSAGHLGRLINNLVELSRLEGGPVPVRLEPVDLCAVVREAIVGLMPVARSRNLRFEVAPGRSPGPARGNREKVFEIATNLLENAVKYSPPGTAVEISVTGEVHGRQTLAVRDHGPGLEPGQDPERLFERFRQGKPSPYERTGGLGLGLYVVRTCMDLLHGTVKAGTHPQGGAVFTCTFASWTGPEDGGDDGQHPHRG
jgi:signal transduction histidine kinase